MSRRFALFILSVAVLCLVVSVGALGLRSIGLLERNVRPILETNALVVTERVRDRIESAVAMGIPYEGLAQVDEYLDRALEGSHGISSIVLASPSGVEMYASGRAQSNQTRTEAEASNSSQQAEPDRLRDRGLQVLPASIQNELLRWLSPEMSATGNRARSSTTGNGVVTLPLLTADGTEFGQIVTRIDQTFVAQQLLDAAADILVMVFVAVVLAVEILLVVMSASISSPLAQVARLLNAVVGKDFRRLEKPAGGASMRRAIRAGNALLEALSTRMADLKARIETGLADAADADRMRTRLRAVGAFVEDGRNKIGTTAHLAGVRGAAFLFVMTEELTRPFLPQFISEVLGSGPAPGFDGMDSTILIAVPISTFMLGAAVVGTLAAGWADRVGRRNGFMIGAALASLGLVITAFAPSLAILILARTVSGVGYALCFLSCQGQAIDQTTTANRTRGMSVFVGGIMAADVCGPAIGGILAEQFGFQLALLVAAGLGLLSILLAMRLLDGRDEAAQSYKSTHFGFEPRIVLECMSQPRFLVAALLAALPAKLLLSGFLFFLVPLLLTDIGATSNEIGRITMLYGASALILMSLFSRLCDRFGLHAFMVSVGALLTGWGLVPLAYGATVSAVAWSVLVLGVAQAMSISAQSALFTILAKREIGTYGPGRVLGIYRMTERAGSVIGPLLAGILSQYWGLAGAAAILGGLSVVTGTGFAAFFLVSGLRSEDDDLKTRGTRGYDVETV
ncbi:MFS transporter [Rhodobacteraceae bacterium B1Z28]|uniref:MFS transporter n=1 Tax=Ruegeria haliotis TaxID=2747601 RepID=A0ABX2PVW8_9RHOB|nr:MFS transporter [Ruegeria haliotis]NVO58344.1 MFS transporter [Ruegeria haliotis]